VLSELFSEEGLATAWWTGDEYFHRPQISFLGELILYKLDVSSYTGHTMPIELEDFGTSFFSIFASTTSGSRFDKKTTWCHLEVEEKRLLPVKIQLNGSQARMRFLERFRNINRLYQSCSYAIGNRTYNFLLGRFLVIIDGEDILALWFGLENLLDHSGEIGHMNCWKEVVSISDVGKSYWILKPGFFDMRVEDSLTLSVKDTSRDNIGLDILLFEIEYFILDLLDYFIFFDWISLLVIELSPGEMSILLSDLLLLFWFHFLLLLLLFFFA